MRFSLKFNMDNDAFADAPTIEAARILRELAEKAEMQHGYKLPVGGRVRDVNGNTVGEWKITGR